MPVLIRSGFVDFLVTSLIKLRSKLSPDGIFQMSIPILFKTSIDLFEKTDELKTFFFL